MTEDTEAAVAAVARIDAVPLILDVVCRTTGMGFAAVARVTEDRWIACGLRDDINFGLRPGGELKVETTICHEIRASGEAVIIDHVAEDAAYRGHPTPAMYGFQSYISMPIRRSDGSLFGTLCAIDPRPMRLNTPETIGMFKLFAELIAFHLDAQDRMDRSEEALVDERRNAELREQFIAVLGHDLRNPLAAVDAGVRLLSKQPLDENAKSVLGLIHGSVRRMAGLIDSVLDFARGRLGGGLTLRPAATEPREMLDQVVAELRTQWPDRVIETRYDLIQSIHCDRVRIGQLLSNLLANALTHGASNGPVRVTASARDGIFELAVANPGEPISQATIKQLFLPFHRNSLQPSRQGLGLGLYIAAMIASEHRGTLDVASSEAETCFTFRMPAS
jgi:signal transduction histidine kinase